MFSAKAMKIANPCPCGCQRVKWKLISSLDIEAVGFKIQDEQIRMSDHAALKRDQQTSVVAMMKEGEDYQHSD